IVTPHPGTTRDTIEERVLINGLLFRLIDTAGLRQATDPAEEAGVTRTHASVRSADIIVLVEDGSLPVEEREIETAVADCIGNQRLIVALNKSDLPSRTVDSEIYPRLSARGSRVVKTSAITGSGLQELRNALYESVARDARDATSGIEVTSRRHLDALTRASVAITEAMQTLDAGRSNEFVALDVRDAILALGEITGDVTSEEILNTVFSKFCIGK
ncbi:GTP-binding protein, partial [bacterium]|nr:GTP-binding protein [bacterium]